MRLDASLGFDPALRDLPDLVRRAESLGVAGLWSADVSHDPFLPLVVAAEHSHRIELGTAIAVAFAQSPVSMAMTAWDLARLSRGRFILGLGSQVRAHVERRFGMTWSGRPVAEIAEARRTIGFYASTPTYRPVLEHHGWGEVADALAGHARHGRWDEMAELVGDDMLDAFAVVSAPDDARAALDRRAEGLADRVAPYAAFGTGAWAALSP